MNGRKVIKRIGIIIIVVFSLVTTGWAEDISFEATVDRKSVQLGSFFQLTLTIKGDQSVAPLELPEIDGLQSQYIGPSTRVSIINGQYSSFRSFLYHIYPTRVGKIKIPSLAVTIKGNEYQTQPTDIEVFSENTNVPIDQAQSQQKISLKDRIFVIMGIPKDTYYVNEQIPVSIRLFVNNLNIKNIQYPEFEHTGFTVGEFDKPKRYKQVVGGVKYDVVEFTLPVYPTREGTLPLGPTRQVCEIVFKGSEDQGRSRFGFFDDDFFDSFFGNYDVRSLTLESSEVTLNIRPLPQEGQPDNFDGAVGTYDFDMNINPKEVNVGDPLTLRMRISGDGNLKAVQFPSFDNQGLFKTYDPQIKEEGSAKVLEQVVIPKTADIQEFPLVRFSFFDPKENQYLTISKGPFLLKVNSLGKGEDLKVIGLDKEGQVFYKEEELGKDIVFIKELPGHLQSQGFVLAKNILFWVMIALLFFIWSSLWIIHGIVHKIKTDQVYARKLRAPRYARKGLTQAKGFALKGDQVRFYDTIFKTLQSYLSDKLHMQAGAVTIEKVRENIQQRGIEENVVDNIKDVFSSCEMVRYASIRSDEKKMNAVFELTGEIIDILESRIK